MKNSDVTCPINGVHFPILYRVSSYANTEDAQGRLVPATRKLIGYALDGDANWNIGVQPQFTPVKYPDLTIDIGWVVIRHHRTIEHAEGYRDALFDGDRSIDFLDCTPPRIYGEYFTVAHRPAIFGRFEPAVIYITRVLDPRVGWMDWEFVVGARGVRLSIDDLFGEIVSH